MNKLSYGLLSVLSVEPQTGYALMLKLNLFWHTTHSAVYPLLYELEDLGYVIHEVIEQTGKPDKKLYSITDKGKEELKKWITSTTSMAVIKDEMHLKLFCIQVLDNETIEILLSEIENRCQKKLAQVTKNLANFKNVVDGEIHSFHSPKIGSYILIQRTIGEIKMEMNWCRWIRSLYEENKSINFFDHDFTEWMYKM